MTDIRCRSCGILMGYGQWTGLSRHKFWCTRECAQTLLQGSDTQIRDEVAFALYSGGVSIDEIARFTRTSVSDLRKLFYRLRLPGFRSGRSGAIGRPRGRPRIDGLPAGSAQARRADANKRAEKLKRRSR